MQTRRQRRGGGRGGGGGIGSGGGRGGGGGTLARQLQRSRRRAGPYEYSGHNGHQVTTGEQALMLPAADPFDRAHEQFDAFGLLRPAAWEDEWGEVHLDTTLPSRPRLYPLTHFVAIAHDPEGRPLRGITFEQACIDHDRRVAALAAAGIHLGRVRYHPHEDLYAVGGISLRDLVEPRTRVAARGRRGQAELAAEAALEAQADAWLARAEAVMPGGSGT